MRIITDTKLDFSDVLIVPHRSTLSSRSEVSLERTYTFKHGRAQYTGIPIIAANMDTVGCIEVAIALRDYNLSTALHKHYPTERLIRFFSDPHIKNDCIFYSMGSSEDDFEKFKEIFTESEVYLPYIVVDVANGYSEKFVETIQKIREQVGNTSVIMAGNVVTGDIAEQLIVAGADIIKVGIGPGSVCTTRKKTGVGYPQLSAVIEVADAVHGMGGHVCSDGGCTVPGDVGKAFGAGADFVMLGGMLAGHEECEGEKVYTDSKTPLYSSTAERAEELNELVYFNPLEQQFYTRSSTNENVWEKTDYNTLDDTTPSHMRFYGMSSKEAMEKHAGGVAEYRASEGKSVLIPYKGEIKNTVQDILGGLRSTCTYVGAKTLKELSKRTTFIKVNNTHNKVYGD